MEQDEKLLRMVTAQKELEDSKAAANAHAVRHSFVHDVERKDRESCTIKNARISQLDAGAPAF